MAVPIVMPKLGMVMTEGTLTRWMKSPGDPVKKGEPVAEIETEKINYELEATDAGLLHTAVGAGAIVPVDGVMGYLLAEGEAAPEPAEREPEPTRSRPAPVTAVRPATPPRPRAGERVPSTPGARRLARELGIDVGAVPATGPRGRVVEADVRAYADRRQPPEADGPHQSGASKVTPLEGMRKAVAGHLLRSITSTAQLSFFLEVDVTDVQRLRREASKGDEKIGLGHVLIKACSDTIGLVPQLNTVLLNGNVLHFDRVNIGFAAALEDGLIVPVIHEVQEKSLVQVAAEASDLAARAVEGKLRADDVTGGTFSISVLGSVDGFTPILNAGQNALLGVGRTVEKPVVRGGEIVVRETCTLSLTVDHQVIDGAVAASFLRRLQRTVERPARLFA